MRHKSLIFKRSASGILGAFFKIAMRQSRAATSLVLFISLCCGPSLAFGRILGERFGRLATMVHTSEDKSGNIDL